MPLRPVATALILSDRPCLPATSRRRSPNLQAFAGEVQKSLSTTLMKNFARWQSAAPEQAAIAGVPPGVFRYRCSLRSGIGTVVVGRMPGSNRRPELAAVDNTVGKMVLS